MTGYGPSLTTDRRLFDGSRKQALETGRGRLLVAGLVLTMAFAGVAGRLVDLTVLRGGQGPTVARADTGVGVRVGRGNIVDRNGMILAASLPTVSLFADPLQVIDVEEATEKLAQALPDLSREEIAVKLGSKGRFVWIARNLTPRQHYDINRLGLPGLAFQTGERRVYPHGPLVAHVLGLTDVDGRGTAGLERQFDRVLRAGGAPLRLSIDIRVQTIMRDALSAAVREFNAIGAAGIVMDVRTSEVLSMVSLPDFDPNQPEAAVGNAIFNRASKGVYELGSTFKLFTAAMALDTGTVTLKSHYDASKPIRVGRYLISDYHAKNRRLSVPEIILYSSNIGAAKMALDVGSDEQRRYLDRFGLLKPAAIELPEVGTPLMPEIWRPINTMTISYGHGISVSPLQLANGVATLANGGIRRSATVLKHDGGIDVGRQVISTKTSDNMRRLMRLVVSNGTGRKAAVPGYLVGGKTGTAEKITASGYSRKAKVSSFVGVFPMNAPRYVVFAVVDEPVGNKRTFNYATGGWVAAPVVAQVIRQIGPMLGIAPDTQTELDLPELPTKQAATKPVARKVAMTDQQTENEERIVLGARHALLRAVAATGEQARTVAAARLALHSTMRREVAIR